MVFAILLVCPSCLTVSMWDHVGRADPRLVAVQIDGVTLKSFDVAYCGELVHLEVSSDDRIPSSQPGLREHRWEAVVTTVEPEPPPHDPKAPVPTDVPINEWGALATLSWDSATGTARVKIGEFAADRRFIVSGVAEAHIPKRGARASTIAFATLATPVTLAIDIVLTPVYLIALL